MNQAKLLLKSLGLSLLLALGACGGGGGGGGSVSLTPISITPGLGGFKNANVEAFSIDGVLLASGTTTADSKGRGVSSLQIPDNATGVVILRVSGGPTAEYFDEGKEAFQPFTANDAIYAVVPVTNIKKGASFGVTPLTNMIAGLMGVSADPTNTAQKPTLASVNANATAFDTARLKVAEVTGVPADMLTAAPDVLVDTTTLSEPTQAGLYGLLLAEMAKLANKNSVSALQQAAQGFTAAKNSSTNVNDLKSFSKTVVDGVKEVKNSKQLKPTADLSELNNLIAAANVAATVDVSSVVAMSRTALDTFKQTKQAERTLQASLIATSQDLQGVWDTASGVDMPASAVVTADNKMVLRTTTLSGATRIVLAQFQPTSTGYSATGQELLMQANAVTASSVDVTITDLTSKQGLSLAVTKAGQTDRFMLSYGARYEDKVELANFVGNWADVVGDIKVSWTFDAKGAITGTSSSSCSWAGKLSLRNEAKGVADVVVTETCAGTSVVLKGIAIFKAGSNKGVARVSLFDSEATKALLLELTK
jgi:hypothetical protein